MAALQEILCGLTGETGVPGISAAIVKDGKLDEGASGVVTVGKELPLLTTSSFPLSCLMKFLISVLTVELANRGAFSLEDDLGLAFGGCAPFVLRGVRLRHLVSHTSGYRGLDV